MPVIRAEKQWMRRQFARLAAEATTSGHDHLAATAHLLYEGALVTSTAGDDPRAFATARSAVAGLLG